MTTTTMKKATYIISFVGLLILTVSCEETIILDLKQTSPSVVIEGLVSNKIGRNYVKVSKTAGFYDSGPTVKITNAVVKVIDDRGIEILFKHNPTEAKGAEGYYYADPTFKGEIGRTYKLIVTIGSQVYEAQDELLEVTKIDSLGVHINDDQLEKPDKSNQIYETLLYAKEPKLTKDYYLFKFYRNDSLTYKNNTDVYVANDEGIGENIDGFPSPVYYSVKDTAGVEMYSLSRNGFLYYNGLLNVLNGDGGMLTPPPVNPLSNLSNGALGFFQVSAISKADIVITKDE